MRRAAMTVGARLGWLAYLTVVGGGVPFWPALDADTDVDEPPDDGASARPKDALVETAPQEAETSRERVEIAAA